MRRLPFLLALALSIALCFGFWWAAARPTALPDMAKGRFDCLSYTPTVGDGSPLDPDYRVGIDRIAADMALLKTVTNCVRIYSSLGSQADVVKVAAAAGIDVLLGIWISGDETVTKNEIAGALALVKDNPGNIRLLVVGNEVMLRREMSGQRLAALIEEVKAKSGLPVAYADIPEFWKRNPILADAVDVMMVHILPHWDDPTPVSIDAVQDHVRTILADVRGRFAGKRLAVGEIGWPSAGRTRGNARPSIVNEARFLREFDRTAHAEGVEFVNVIEAVDQPWKRHPEGTVGGYWGIFDKDRQPKFPLSGPVTEWPDLPFRLVLSGVVAALSLGAGLLTRRRPSPAGWLTLAVLGAVLGCTLAWQVRDITLIALGWRETLLFWLAPLLSVGAAGAFAAAMLDRAGPWAQSAPERLIDAARWLRRPRRAEWTPGLALGLLQATTGLWGAIDALLLAIDGRHRDFPISFLWLPALLWTLRYVLQRFGSGTSDPTDRREEGWLAGALVLGGLFSLDVPGNIEATAWAVVCLGLAFPWLGALGTELRRLWRVVVQAKQDQHG